ENTMAAFERAVEIGYRYLETDVRATADGVPVVYHDDSLLRMFGRSGRIEDLTWSDGESLRGRGATVVPTLVDLLDAFPEGRLNIEMKADSAVDPTIEAIWKLTAPALLLLASVRHRRIRRPRQ